MANLIIPFPEGARTVVLRGAQITVGRLPDNTIQIMDRTVSAYHAEIILENGHYRIHDRDATNGVVVDGQQVRDFHLHEGCTIRLGGVECQFRPEDPAPDAEEKMEALPTRTEVNDVRQENSQMKSLVSALREQIEAMTQARKATESGASAVVMEEFDKLAAERAAVQQTCRDRQEEINRLRESLAVVRRDRENLQRAYDDARAAAGKPVAAPLATLATPATTPAPTAPVPFRLPKPPVPLPNGTPSTANAPTTTNTPARRPASAIQMPPARAVPAPRPQTAAAATGPKGTQKLVE
jgi:predicted component of type VI protein secretion system